MVVLSKLFKDGLEKGLQCSDLTHSGSCKQNVTLNTYKFLISNLKYFAPVIFLPLLVHLRSLNKKMLKDTFQYYIGAVAAGTTTGWCIMSMICLLRHVFGKFGYYTTAFLPSLIGSFATWAIPSPKVHRLYETSVFQCTIESFILQRKTMLTKLIAESKLLRTFIFMCCSSLIMNAKQEKSYRGFWLLQPTPTTTLVHPKNQAALNEEAEEESVHLLKPCSHKISSCVRYALQGAKTYFILGLTLDLIKMLMSKVATSEKGFMTKLLAKTGNFKIHSCALLTTYVTFYRLVHCYFNRVCGADTKLNHTAAAFLSGSSFIFYPKLTLFCYALVLGIQISWQHLEVYLSNEHEDAFEWIKNIPFSKLFYSLCLAYLVNTYCLRSRYVSGLGATIINGITNNYAKTINGNIERIEQQLASRSPSL